MNRRVRQHRGPAARQRGMSLIVAIFLVAIIASLAAFAVSASTTTRETTNLQLLADRALAAARSGAEWGAYRALNQGVCTNPYPQLNLTQGALNGFRVNVTCVRSNHTEGVAYGMVDITSVAQRGNYGAPDYAYRRITQRYTNGP